MNIASRSASTTDARLVQILDRYLEALQAGTPPNKSEILAQYPELADDLEACLASMAVIRQGAVGKREVENDRARNDLWLQVGSDDQSRVSINGREIYQCRRPRPLNGLDTIGPVVLEEGTNVLLFKVVNDYVNWQ